MSASRITKRNARNGTAGAADLEDVGKVAMCEERESNQLHVQGQHQATTFILLSTADRVAAIGKHARSVVRAIVRTHLRVKGA